MSALTKCVECGGEVSTAAAECPHCHRSPRPVTCSFCGKPLGESQALGRMHPACYEAHHASKDLDRFSCPVCRSEFAHGSFKFALVQCMELSRPADSSPCPKCGHPFEVEKCDYCGGGMIKGMGEKVHRKSQLPLHVHKTCSRFVQNRAEAVSPKPSCLVVAAALAALPPALMFLVKALL